MMEIQLQLSVAVICCCYCYYGASVRWQVADRQAGCLAIATVEFAVYVEIQMK
jgi:hypothetical protein